VTNEEREVPRAKIRVKQKGVLREVARKGGEGPRGNKEYREELGVPRTKVEDSLNG